MQTKEAHNTRTASNTVLDGKDFQIPTEIKPDDLDWETSRPVKPWFVRRGSYSIPGYWDLAWIELSRTDVTKCSVRRQGASKSPNCLK